jgi:transposase
MVAIRHHPTLRLFYDRLVAGTAKKLALIAATRKLVVILNALVRDGQPWRAPQSA